MDGKFRVIILSDALGVTPITVQLSARCFASCRARRGQREVAFLVAVWFGASEISVYMGVVWPVQNITASVRIGVFVGVVFESQGLEFLLRQLLELSSVYSRLCHSHQSQDFLVACILRDRIDCVQVVPEMGPLQVVLDLRAEYYITEHDGILIASRRIVWCGTASTHKDYEVNPWEVILQVCRNDRYVCSALLTKCRDDNQVAVNIAPTVWDGAISTIPWEMCSNKVKGIEHGIIFEYFPANECEFDISLREFTRGWRRGRYVDCCRVLRARGLGRLALWCCGGPTVFVR